MKKLDEKFFKRKPEKVAKDLLGKLLVRKIGSKYYVGKIVETEAYLSENDLACHASRGKTKRNHVMFGPAGHAYVYMIYGMYHCLNFVTESKQKPSAVLNRAVEPLYENDLKFQISNLKLADMRRLGSGPGKLCRWMKIERSLNGEDLLESNNLFVADEIILRLRLGSSKAIKAEKISQQNIVQTTRVGVDYAGEHKDLPLRFYIKENKFVSKK